MPRESLDNILILCFTDALQQGASQFEQQAGKLKRKFWLQNLKVSSMRVDFLQICPLA